MLPIVRDLFLCYSKKLKTRDLECEKNNGLGEIEYSVKILISEQGICFDEHTPPFTCFALRGYDLPFNMLLL